MYLKVHSPNNGTISRVICAAVIIFLVNNQENKAALSQPWKKWTKNEVTFVFGAPNAGNGNLRKT